MSLGKQSAPAAPDYTSAANATSAGNLQAAQYATQANRVNQVGPNGSITYSSQANDPAYQQAYNDWVSGGKSGEAPVQSAFNQWTQTTTLSPEQQAIQNQENNLNLGLMSTAGQGLNYAQGVLSQPGVDTSKLAQTGINPGQSYLDAMTAQQAPQVEQQKQQLDSQLANQGIGIGSEAYKNAHDIQNESFNNLTAQNTTQGMSTGLAANQQGFQQQAYNQMQPINVINALRTGSQVQGPQFNNVPQQQTTQGADLLGASQGQYNAQVGNVNAANAQTAGMFGTAANLGGAYMLSDRRLKRSITAIGKTKNGLTRYRFKYIWSNKWHEGVMAQEALLVIPQAVMSHWSGFLMVNYSLLGE